MRELSGETEMFHILTDVTVHELYSFVKTC